MSFIPIDYQLSRSPCMYVARPAAVRDCKRSQINPHHGIASGDANARFAPTCKDARVDDPDRVLSTALFLWQATCLMTRV